MSLQYRRYRVIVTIFFFQSSLYVKGSNIPYPLYRSNAAEPFQGDSASWSGLGKNILTTTYLLVEQGEVWALFFPCSKLGFFNWSCKMPWNLLIKYPHNLTSSFYSSPLLFFSVILQEIKFLGLRQTCLKIRDKDKKSIRYVVFYERKLSLQTFYFPKLQKKEIPWSLCLNSFIFWLSLLCQYTLLLFRMTVNVSDVFYLGAARLLTWRPPW